MKNKSVIAFAALVAASSLVHAANSSATIGTPVFSLFDLDPLDGITPSFHVFRPGVDFQPGSNPQDFRFSLGIFAPSESSTTGSATTASVLGANAVLRSFGGSTNGGVGFYDGYDTSYRVNVNHGDLFALTPETQVNITFPFTLAWNAKDGGSASASIDVESQLIAGVDTRYSGRYVALLNTSDRRMTTAGSAENGNPVGNLVSQFVLSMKNTTREGGVFANFYGLLARGQSAAVGCMRSAFH
jgi:hypothetical protein